MQLAYHTSVFLCRAIDQAETAWKTTRTARIPWWEETEDDTERCS